MNLPENTRSSLFRGPQSGSRVLIVLSAVLAVTALTSCQEQREVEVAHDFEGEADPDRMTLGMKTWTWIKTEYNNDTVKEPAEKDAFTLSFSDGRVQGTTDCNSFNGAYSLGDRKIHFDDKFAMTRMFCPDSQEKEFVAMLLEVDSFFFTSRGRLILEIKSDSGSMHFR